MRLAIGQARVTSAIIGESALLSFGVLHFGDHNLIGSVRQGVDGQRGRAFAKGVVEAFDRADLSEVLQRLTEEFGPLSYSLKSLFRDEQRKILGPILAAPLVDVEASYRQIYERYTPLLRFLTDLDISLPRGLAVAAELALGATLRHALVAAEPDPQQIRTILDDARRAGITLDGTTGIGYAVEQIIGRLTDHLRAQPLDLIRLQRIETAVDLAGLLPFEVNVWKTQNTYYELLQTTAPALRVAAAAGDEAAGQWLAHLSALGERLGVRGEQ
jgi:Domain of unknown function (DUF3536)